MKAAVYCAGTTLKGVPCRMLATQGSAYCRPHGGEPTPVVHHRCLRPKDNGQLCWQRVREAGQACTWHGGERVPAEERASP